MNKKLFLISVFLAIISLITVNSQNIYAYDKEDVNSQNFQTYDTNNMMEESENVNDFQVPTTTEINNQEDIDADEHDIQNAGDEEEENEEVSFDSYKLAGFECSLGRFRKNVLTCKRQFGAAPTGRPRAIRNAGRFFKNLYSCSKVYNYRKNIGEGKRVSYEVKLCQKSRNSVQYMKQVIENEYCAKNPQNCEKGADGYDRFKKRDAKVADDFYVNYAFKIDLSAKVLETETKLKEALTLSQPLPKFTCAVRTGKSGKVSRKVCQKKYGYSGADAKCNGLFHGQFVESNNSTWVLYVSSICVQKAQGKALRKQLKSLRRSVVDDYCGKNKDQCVSKRNKNKYIRKVGTIAKYQTFILTAEPAFNATATRKWRFGGKFKKGNKLKKYKTVKLTFPVTIDGKNVTVTREVKIDTTTGDYFLVPSTNPADQKQDAQIQTQVESNPRTASFVTAQVAQNSGKALVLSIAVVLISAILFAF